MLDAMNRVGIPICKAALAANTMVRGGQTWGAKQVTALVHSWPCSQHHDTQDMRQHVHFGPQTLIPRSLPGRSLHCSAVAHHSLHAPAATQNCFCTSDLPCFAAKCIINTIKIAYSPLLHTERSLCFGCAPGQLLTGLLE